MVTQFGRLGIREQPGEDDGAWGDDEKHGKRHASDSPPGLGITEVRLPTRRALFEPAASEEQEFPVVSVAAPGLDLSWKVESSYGPDGVRR